MGATNCPFFPGLDLVGVNAVTQKVGRKMEVMYDVCLDERCLQQIESATQH
jgi:hypothetical protein